MKNRLLSFNFFISGLSGLASNDMKDRPFKIYQIYYDNSSRQMLDKGFIPLDNTSNERPDWFEFWVIRRFLHETQLREDTWYGFFSPKLRGKTGLESAHVFAYLEQCASRAEVALFSPGWDQIAYFKNPFEQGNFWHPGLLELSQHFFNKIGFNVDLHTLVTHSATTVFSNNIVAKPAFWREWLRIADLFYEFVEHDSSQLSAEIRSTTEYGSAVWQTPMKTFIQERFATMVLAQGNFRVAAVDFSANSPIYARLFADNSHTRRLLQTCDLLKQRFSATREEDYLKMYQKFRALVPANTSRA